MPSPNSSRHYIRCTKFYPRVLSALLHITGLISFSLSFRFLESHPTTVTKAYGGQWQFLTVLGLTLSCATFLFGLLADITLYAPLLFLHHKLALCSTPLETVVSIVYWTLSIIDPNLLVSPGIHIGLSADFGLHAMPTILLILDLILFSPPWTISISQAAAISSTVGASYWMFLEHCFSQNEFYPYPLLGKLNLVQRATLFFFCAILMALNSLLLQRLQRSFTNALKEEKNKVI
ncbi:UPF0641 membrane protein [Golovinomyces cichoracearum]|uniref:UPF0641 membrane protein n=1 Tax=Golovinomyces cichoracearum TaxID=62708 RepID=A0A420I4G0_9PEZI|nr:UPF0641 membrane protein [Golovinomyces cichoracearum]